jgi:hypothetical protein
MSFLFVFFNMAYLIILKTYIYVTYFSGFMYNEANVLQLISEILIFGDAVLIFICYCLDSC